MFLPTLQAAAVSLNRNIKQPIVTELLAGIMEIFLRRTTDYVVGPIKQLYTRHGSDVHMLNEKIILIKIY